jgi:hypothetical protein
VESIILGRSRKQRKENENFLRKKMLATSFGKHFRNNLLGCLALSMNILMEQRKNKEWDVECFSKVSS